MTGAPATRGEFIAGASASLAAPALAGSGARGRRVRFGVNYVPTEKWWYCWGDWDRSSIRRDLDDVAALGVDHIRIQLLWPYFQPNATLISGDHIARLVQLLDDAHARSLQVEVTVLDGQLSGFLFTPAFLIDNQDGHIRNIITDPAMIEIEKTLFGALAREIGTHPAFLGFDISNEVFWFTIPLQIKYTPEQGDAWMNALLSYCDQVAPGKLHVNGVDKYPYGSSQENAFTRRGLMKAGATSCIHPWAGFSPVFQKYGPLSDASTHYAEFWIQYMQAFSTDGKRSIWVEEDGCSKQWMQEHLIPQWADHSVRNAVSCANLFGFTWWCSHDVNTRYTGFNKLEYDLGLYTNDRKLKPLGKTFAALIRELGTSPSVLARPHAIIIDDSAGGEDAFDPYVEALKNGVRPQIALKSRAQDTAYLRGRGITSLS